MWYFETKVDHTKAELMPALFSAEAPAETIDGFVANISACIAKWDARWADDRVHAAGANVTAADYDLLAGFTCYVSNTGVKNASIQTRLTEVYNSSPNYKRVVDNIKSELQATVDALPVSHI